MHPALGRHLRAAVRTGTRCSYAPAQETAWQVRAGVAAPPGTVCPALRCGAFASVNATAGLGPVGAMGVAVSAAAMLTLLPALLLIGGRRAFWPFVPHTPETRPAGEAMGGSRFAALIIVIVVVDVLAIPLHVRDLAWTPSLPAGTVTMDLALSRPLASPVTVAVAMRLGDEVLAQTGIRVAEQTARHTVHLPAAANAAGFVGFARASAPLVPGATWRLTSDARRSVGLSMCSTGS